tara:strand:- start:2623 stop:3081 length:459 start_codon:yes stop_codon:yes gene_type:complete
MINVSALVKDLAPSQNTFYLIKAFNSMIKNTDISTSVFFHRQAVPPVRTLFSCRSTYCLSSYHGKVISTSLEETQTSLKASNNSDKFYYVWDLEWLHNPVNFGTVIKIMRDSRLKIIARSKSHAEVIENFSNKEVIGIVDNWDMNKILEITK